MEQIEKKKYLAQVITKEKIRNYGTTILIGEAVPVFKSIYSGHIISISTAEEVKEFLVEYSKESEETLVFEDISLMNKQVQSYLLKFFEKPCRPLVVLASIDNLSSIMLSRFNNIVKLPETIKYDSTSLDKFLEEHEKDLKSNYILPDLKEESAKYCPEYYYNFKLLALSKHENKNKNQIIRYL